MIQKIVKNLSKYMLVYTLLVIILGIYASYTYSLSFLSNYIMPIVFLMIYPMMVNVSFESLKQIKKAHKSVLISLFLNFILAPLLYWVLCLIFHAPLNMEIALILLSVAPASSMGLGYVGLAKGDMIVASVIVALAFILSLFVYPTTIHILNLGKNVVPISQVINSLIFVLLLPLILGLITREFIIEKNNKDFKTLKPYFSLITLVFLYILIFVIFALKGQLIIKHWENVVLISPIAIIYYTIMLLVAILFNKYIAKLDYSHNQSIVFTTVSKNVALTIGLLATIFGKEGHTMAMYPAIISIFQIVFLMVYLHFSEQVRQWWES